MNIVKFYMMEDAKKWKDLRKQNDNISARNLSTYAFEVDTGVSGIECVKKKVLEYTPIYQERMLELYNNSSIKEVRWTWAADYNTGMVHILCYALD